MQLPARPVQDGPEDAAAPRRKKRKSGDMLASAAVIEVKDEVKREIKPRIDEDVSRCAVRVSTGS